MLSQAKYQTKMKKKEKNTEKRAKNKMAKRGDATVRQGTVNDLADTLVLCQLALPFPFFHSLNQNIMTRQPATTGIFCVFPFYKIRPIRR